MATILVILVAYIAPPSTTAPRAYDDYLWQLSAAKEQLKNNITLSAAEQNQKLSDLLFVTLIDSIFPAWYDTPWDFNGISNVPGEGEIACGYFVSTTLKHAGFNLNRYKLAQQGANEIATAICGKSNLKRYASSQEIVMDLLAQGEGYILSD